MKVCFIVLSYLATAVVIGVSLTIVVRGGRRIRPLVDEEDYLLISALSLVWPPLLAGALVGLAAWSGLKGFSMVIRLGLRVVDAVVCKKKGGGDAD